MAKLKYDGVVEAAHFSPDGKLDWIRVYERRNAVFTDRIILSREGFISQIKAGKRYFLGQRIPNMGGKFTTSQAIKLMGDNDQQVIVLDDSPAALGELVGVPII